MKNSTLPSLCNPQANRYYSLDYARAIAIILVVIGHYWPPLVPKWYAIIHDAIYSFHMPLFLAISGFLYMATQNTKQQYLPFLKKKAYRLLVPYLTVSVIIITIKLAVPSNAGVEAPVTPMAYLQMFYLPVAGAFLWFIWTIWWMFCIIHLLSKKRQRLIFFLLCIFMNLSINFDINIFCISTTIKMAIWFMTGVMIYDYNRIWTYISQVPLWAITIIFIGTQTLLLCEISGASYIAPWIGIWFSLTVCTYIELYCHNIHKILIYISAASYLIYLLHTTFMGFAKTAVNHTLLLYSYSIITFTVSAIVVIITGVAGPLLFRRYPVLPYRPMRFLFSA